MNGPGNDTPASARAPTAGPSAHGAGVWGFLRHGVWRVPTDGLPWWKRLGVAFLRLCLLVGRDFKRNDCSQQAAALTYATLMSMVPVLALMFSVSKGLGAHAKVMEMLQTRLAGLPPEAKQFADQIFQSVDQTNFATLGTVGLVLLFWTVISLLTQVETSFNTLWHISTPRTWIRRFQAYISILVVVPVFLLAATSANAMLSSERVSELLQVQLGPLYWIWQTGAGCAGIVSIIAGFVMLYLTMPNTRVRFSAALAGGLVAGVAWYATQRLILAGTIVSVAKYGAIYGTFATIMVFLFWVYLNWVIVLAGAMFSFAVQNHDNDEVIFESQRLPFGTAQAMGLLVTWEICSAAATGAPPWTARDFARRQRLSMKVVHDLLGVLTRAGLVAEVAAHPGGYLPARDAGILTPADVELAFRADSPDDDPVAMPATAPVLALFEERFGGFTAALRQTSFRDLLATPPAAPKTEA